MQATWPISSPSGARASDAGALHPLPETIGAIIAGVFLGALSLWARSIWMGVLVHVSVSVAVSMDLAAMHYRGELGTLFGI